MIDLNKYNTFLYERRAAIKALEASITNNRMAIADNEKLLANTTTARDIVSAVGVAAQEKLTAVIEELTTKALQTVFDDTYSFKIESKISRNKVEAFIYVVVDGKQLTLRDDLGGGVVDVVSFALRIIMWALDCKKRSNTIILDEPARCVSHDKISLFGEMLKQMSSMLGLQFIIVSHEDDLIACADKAYKVSIENGISKVTEV